MKLDTGVVMYPQYFCTYRAKKHSLEFFTNQVNYRACLLDFIAGKLGNYLRPFEYAVTFKYMDNKYKM